MTQSLLTSQTRFFGTFLQPLTCIAALGMAVATAQAVVLTWDGDTTYGVSNVSGNWGGSSLWNSPDNTSANVSWNSATPDDAYFTGVNKTYTVTLTGTATAGNVTFANTAGSVTVSGSALTLGGMLTANAASNVVINASLAGAGSVSTSGTLTLGGTQRTFSGGLTMNAGSVLVTAASATSTYVSGASGPLASGVFGTGTLTINGGKISNDTYGGLNVANNIVINQNFSVATQNGILRGTVDLAEGTRTITNAHASQFTNFIGTITNGGLAIASSSPTNVGGILLGGSTSTFAGGVTVQSGGVLAVTGTSTQLGGIVTRGPLGTGTLTLNSGATVNFNYASSGAAKISNNIVVAGDFSTNSNPNASVNGPIDLGSGIRKITSTAHASVLNLAGTISGAGGLNLSGTGTVALSGVGNNFAGGITVSSGTLSITGNSTQSGGVVTNGPLGTGTLTINGGGVNISNLTNFSNSVVVASDFNTNSNGNGFVSGTTDLGSVTRKITSVAAGSTLNLNGRIIGTGGLTLSGTGKVGLGGATSNTYTGLTTLAMTAGVANTLSLNKSAGFVAIPGDLLITSGTLAYGSTVNNQINTTSTVTMNGGVWSLNNTNAGVTQQLSKLVYNTGTSGLTFGTATASGLMLGTGAVTPNNTVQISIGGTLAGSGTLGCLVAGRAGGTIAPGKIGGNLTAGTLTLANGLDLSAVTGKASNISVNFSLASGTNGLSDKLAITSGVLTGAGGTGGIVVNLTDAGLDLTQGTHQTFTIFDWSGAASATAVDLLDFKLGTFSYDTSTLDISNVQFAFSNGNTALDVSLDIIAVPEPSSVCLTIFGGLAVLALRKRRNA